MSPLLAEIDATGWAVIITAAIGGFATLVTQVVQLVLDYMREQNRLQRAEVIATKVEKQNEKTELILEKVGEVKSAVVGQNAGGQGE